MKARAALYALGGLLAWWAKHGYSRAGADELGWILGPTCRLAALVGGIEFEWEPHEGWVSHSARLIVGKSCAGVNFLIVAFLALYFSFLHRLGDIRSRTLWLPASAGLAYLLAVLANSLRIVVAVQLDTTSPWLHRIEGTLVYCITLWVAHRSVDRLLSPTRASRRQAILRALAPFGWYALVALGVPLAGGAYRREGAAFVEHAAVVAALLLGLSLLVALWQAPWRGKIPGP